MSNAHLEISIIFIFRPLSSVSSIQLLDGILDILITSKLHHSLVSAGLVSLGPGNLTGLLHVVLQAPPGDPAGDVVHEDPVLRASARLLPVSGPPGVPAAAGAGAILGNDAKT